jgi:hypothetical protein
MTKEELKTKLILDIYYNLRCCYDFHLNSICLYNNITSKTFKFNKLFLTISEDINLIYKDNIIEYSIGEVKNKSTFFNELTILQLQLILIHFKRVVNERRNKK